jgi:hypothetical protein
MPTHAHPRLPFTMGIGYFSVRGRHTRAAGAKDTSRARNAAKPRRRTGSLPSRLVLLAFRARLTVRRNKRARFVLRYLLNCLSASFHLLFLPVTKAIVRRNLLVRDGLQGEQERRRAAAASRPQQQGQKGVVQGRCRCVVDQGGGHPHPVHAAAPLEV